MAHRIVVGDVEIRTDLALTVRQLRRLLMDAAGIAAALAPPLPASEDAEPRAPLGFTAALERAEPTDLTPPWYDDEE